jgi:DNA polymerase III alpha subunit
MLKWFSFGNGLIRPACASYRDEVAEGKFYTNGLKELDEFLAPTLGHVTMQEDIMQFLVRFCGYSQAESDTVRRGIAKKKGTEKLLPEIEQRFIQYASEHFNVSKEHCAKVIKPFLQVIMDASAYAFSWNHSDSYSCIGYICGYLRYYYPLEFLTAALNIFKSNTEKTAKIIEYASSKGILVQPPRFGKARSVYSYDHGTNSISKGMASIKYLNAASADELYVKCQNSYQYFMDVLQAIKANTTLNTRQIDVLIKLDFFQQYGNARELSEINQMYEFFKCGESKQITKTKVENEALLKIIEQYSNGLNKNGSESKSYTITDMPKLLITCEEWIKSKHLPDFHYKGKMLDQQEFLGYIDLTTNNPDDRRKLFVTEIRPLKSKDDTGAIWGYAVFTKSLGSGKNSRLTLRKNLYDKRPVDKSDIINAQSIVKNDKGYWYLMQYTVL